jgi:hypothetical protein
VAKTPKSTKFSGNRRTQSATKQINRDASAPFKITAAVAFGDFLISDRPRVQAADVGIRLVRRNEPDGEFLSSDKTR